MIKRKYKLTVGIPTWNRKQFLASNMEHLIKEIENESEVEILISDNASEDGTQELCQSYQKLYSHVAYYRNPKNLGANFNFQNVIEKAQGAYVWLLGDDDKIVEGSIKEVLRKIKFHPDIDMIVGGCINDHSRKRLYPPFLDHDHIFQTEILDAYDAIRLAGKISTLIFKRASLSHNLPACQKTIESIRTPWPHLVWWLVVLGQGKKVLFLKAPTNYYLESSRYNMIQDGVTQNRIRIEDYARLIIKLKQESLIQRDLFNKLKKTISYGRAGEFIKIVAYSTFLNNYQETIQAAYRTLNVLPGVRNRFRFLLYYFLPVLLPVNFRKLLFLAPYYVFPWQEYKNFINYLNRVKQILDSKKYSARAVFNESDL